jgi:phosphate acetyltransferase
MSRTLLVVPTGPAVGLTSACLGLLRALDQLGVRVGYVKPFAQPRREGGVDPSTDLVRALTSLQPPEPLLALDVHQRLGSGGIDSALEEAVMRWEPIRDTHDVVVVEALKPDPTQSWISRLNEGMATALDAEVILVGSYPTAEPTKPSGAAQDDLALRQAFELIAEDLAIARSAYTRGEHVRVVGCMVTRVPGSSAAVHDGLADVLRRHGMELIAAVPSQPELAAPRVRDLVNEMRPRVLSEGDLSRRIEDVAVFAQAVPGGLWTLSEGRLIVVPGDRHEVIMAACLAALNGTRLAALLLSMGVEPDPEVWALTKAAAATGLPILVTSASTYETAMRVRDIEISLTLEDPERAEAVMAHGADAVDSTVLQTVLAAPVGRRLSPAAFRYRLTKLARAIGARIVLPEGAEPRTIRAAAICAERGIARPVLLGEPDVIHRLATSLGVRLPSSVEVIDPKAVADSYVAALAERRRSKGWTLEMARERLSDPIYVGTMMLAQGDVAGLVAGAEHTTADTVRPALQILGTRPGARLVSSVFFMCLPDEVLVYGDCAINPQPTAEELADVAIQSAESARAFGIEPRVALISFSTGSSGTGDDVAKVAEATRLVRERAPELAVDGPLQYDAATSMSVGRSKRPGSAVAGQATVFIFPDLDSGNTTYKAVQRSADVISIGPMLQGMAKPVNDLSRGALVEDIVYTIALTAVQSSLT